MANFRIMGRSVYTETGWKVVKKKKVRKETFAETCLRGNVPHNVWRGITGG